jgi:hypothetical protein
VGRLAGERLSAISSPAAYVGGGRIGVAPSSP